MLSTIGQQTKIRGVWQPTLGASRVNHSLHQQQILFFQHKAWHALDYTNYIMPKQERELTWNLQILWQSANSV